MPLRTPKHLGASAPKTKTYAGVFRESTDDDDRPSRRFISAISPVWHHTQRFRRRHGRRASGIRHKGYGLAYGIRQKACGIRAGGIRHKT